MKKVLLLLLSCFSMAYAQRAIQSTNKQAQKSYEVAGKFLSVKQYQDAILKLNEAVKIDPDFVSAYQQLADVQRLLGLYQDATRNYKRVIEIDPDFYPATYFWLGETELKSGNYTAALQYLQKYVSFPDLPETRKKLCSKYLADCQFSLQAIKNPVSFSPVNLGESVNTRASEYLPVLTADEEQLIFTRRTNNNEDFYQSKKTNSGWEPSRYLSPNINTEFFNEGAQCISPDGMYLFFTGCNRPDGLGRCDIFICRKEGSGWSRPFNLGHPINTQGWESQPSVSADGRTLFFISTRPGGFGGFDIWKTTLLKGGNWSDPVNLGPQINTPYDEESPFIHPDGKTLYFSSTGWPGLGGRDLFVSRMDKQGNWDHPKNLGYPINTFRDEGGLSVSADGKTAYFSSNSQEGFGEMDIYSFQLVKDLRPELVTYVKGSVLDEKTKEHLDAQVKITDLDGGNFEFEESTGASGKFLATLIVGRRYALSVEKAGYLLYSENLSLDRPQAETSPVILNVALRKIGIGEMVTLKNIFFENNKYDLLPESKIELLQLIRFLKLNPSLRIEIGGYTDNIGDEKSNLMLSEYRARSVYNFLIQNTVDVSRLSFKGYGESGSVADNSTEEGRKQNRRTEFKILKN